MSDRDVSAARRRFSPSRFLRSRRLALVLILIVIVYAIIGTLVPQVSLKGGAEVGRWQAAHPLAAFFTRILGLHQAFSSWPFLVVISLLALSTAACSWERTRASWRVMRREGTIPASSIRRLREHPRLTVPVFETPAEDVLAGVERELGRVHLRARRGPKLLEASGGKLGLLGSPLFHAMLTLLFVVIALGRLTRSEGFIGVPLDSPVNDVAASYGVLHEGPLYLGHTGYTISASDLVFDYKDTDGVPRGASPVVTVADGATVLAKGHVYPNAPLRVGRLLVHMDAFGLSPRFSLETSAGQPAGGTHTMVDFDAGRPAGTTQGMLDMTRGFGQVSYQLAVDVPTDRDGKTVVARVPRDPRVEVRIVGQGSAPVTLRPGQAMTLPQGYRLRLDKLGYYVRLSVADDWSVYPMYLLFVLAGAAMSVSVLVPYRTVHVLLVEGDEGPELHAAFTHRRGDPLFADRVESALRAAAGTEPAQKEESA